MSAARKIVVTDVVERKMAYENSTHGRSLGGIAQQYVQAGGFTDKTALLPTESLRPRERALGRR